MFTLGHLLTWHLMLEKDLIFKDETWVCLLLLSSVVSFMSFCYLSLNWLFQINKSGEFNFHDKNANMTLSLSTVNSTEICEINPHSMQHCPTLEFS